MYGNKQRRRKKKLNDCEKIWFSIAEVLSSTVAEAKARVSFVEFLQWVKYFKINPPAKDHLNIVGANIAYTIFSVMKGKGGPSLELKDFMLDYEKANMTQADKMAAATKKIDIVFSGLVAKQEKKKICQIVKVK